MRGNRAARRLIARIALVIFASALLSPCGLVPLRTDSSAGAAMSHGHSWLGAGGHAALSRQGTCASCGTDIAAAAAKFDLATPLPRNAGKASALPPAVRTAFVPSLVAFADAQARPPQISRRNTILTQRLQL